MNASCTIIPKPDFWIRAAIIAVLCANVIGRAQTAHVDAEFGSIPLYFEENRGQADSRVRYIGRTGNLTSFVTVDGLRVSSGGDSVAMTVVGANRKATIAPVGSVEGVTNYYIGSRAITGLPHFQRVQISGVRAGIDVIYHGDRGELEYDLIFHPGANASQLRLKFDGKKRPALAENGDVVIKTASGELRQKKPRVWQDIGSERREIDCRYAVAGRSEVRLVLGNYSSSAELVVDPVIVYSTFLGGSSGTGARAIAVDGSGFAYLAGSTSSADFPVTTGTYHGATDAFVTKLNAAGTALIYSTFLGGSGTDAANGIAIDNAGNAYVTGSTSSGDFPFTMNNGPGAYVIKLGTTGNIVYATALPCFNVCAGQAVAVDSLGAAYAAGYASSTNFPTTVGGFQTTPAGGYDAFVAKVSPAGQISYATYLGGTSDDFANAIAVDPSGNAYVGGQTASSNFPTTANAFQTNVSSSPHGFVTKLNPAGSALVYSTYIGGSGVESVVGLGIDVAGNCYVTGGTTSTDFPTTPNAYETSKPAPQTVVGIEPSGFVSKLNATGTALVYGTYLGGQASTAPTSIAVDLNGLVYVGGVAGLTNDGSLSCEFPTTTGALETTKPCGVHTFLVQLSTDASMLTYSTYLADLSLSNPAGLGAHVALDGKGGVYVASSTVNVNYPTTIGAYQTANPTGGSLAYTPVVTKIDFNTSTLCTPSASPVLQSVPATGGAFSVSLSLAPGCPWEAVASTTSPLNSITFSSPTHGVVSTSPVTISGTLGVNNDTIYAQAAIVNIGSASFIVSQEPSSCPGPVISPPASISIDSSGGSRTMALTLPGPCAWSAISSAPWLTVPTGSNGKGSASITIQAGPNNFSTRNATLSLAGRSIPVSQSGGSCTATASGSPNAFTAQGGTGVLRINPSSSSCAWTAYNTANWIQFAPLTSSGQGMADIPFVAGPNTGSIARSTQILIADQLVTISQAAGPTGTVGSYTSSIFAGGGSISSGLGDGGSALGAALDARSLAFDSATGDLYVLDYSSLRIRVITPDGNVNTFAGGGTSTAENVPATTAQFNQPWSLAVDSSSAVYDSEYGRVRRISQGNIATFAGTGVIGYSGDNGPATSAMLGGSYGLAAPLSGVVYVAEATNNRIRKVSGGIITTFAGGGSSGLGDNGPATSATLNNPIGVATDAAGNVYIADTNNSRIRKVSQGIITTIAGGGTGGDGPAISASTPYPDDITLDPLGQLFFSESFSKLRRIAADGTLTTLLSSPFNNLNGLATDSSGNVYYGDNVNHTILKLTPVPTFCAYDVASQAVIGAGGSQVSFAVNTAPGCNWTAASDLSWLTLLSGSPGGGNGTVTFNSSTNIGPQRVGTITIAGHAVQITQSSGGRPVAVSVTPNSGMGAGQTFQFQFSDSGGASDLVALEAWITPSPSTAANSCLIYYGVGSHLLYLAADDISTWSSQTIGTPGTLQNSQCALNVGGAMATPSGNNLTLSVPITFNASFAGTKQIFMFGVGSSANSGWQIMGTWTTSTATPSVTSVTPNAGNGLTQTFQFKASDTGGFGDLLAMEGWITPSPATAVNTCLIYFATATNLLYLAADDVASWTPQTIGTTGILQNSQCTVNVGGATVSGSGNTLTLSVPITFKPTFAGTKQIFMFGVGTNGNSGWQIMGTWTPSPAAVSLVSVTPNAGSGSSQTFQFKASDTGGAADLQAVEAWFTSSTANPVNTCLIYFATATQLLYLMKDDASGWTSQQIGSVGTLQNSQCTLNVGATTAVGSGNTLTLSVPVTFKPAFAGAKQTWMCATGTNANTGFQNIGGWTVQ